MFRLLLKFGLCFGQWTYFNILITNDTKLLSINERIDNGKLWVRWVVESTYLNFIIVYQFILSMLGIISINRLKPSSTMLIVDFLQCMFLFSLICKLVIKYHPNQFMLQWFWLTHQNMSWVSLALRVLVQMALKIKLSKRWFMLAPIYISKDGKPSKEDIYISKDTIVLKWSYNVV